MDPFTMFAMALGMGVTAAGKLAAGYQSSNTALLSAEIHRGNEDLLRSQADALLLGKGTADVKAVFESGRVREKLDRVIAGQSGYFSHGHLDPLGASPLVLAAASAAHAETDIGLIRARAKVEQADIQSHVATIYGRIAGEEGQANQLTAKAANDRMAGWFGAATALLAPAAKWPGLSSGGASGNAFFPSASFLDHGFEFDN